VVWGKYNINNNFEMTILFYMYNYSLAFFLIFYSFTYVGMLKTLIIRQSNVKAKNKRFHIIKLK